MRTITNLYNKADIVFIRIDNETTAKKFLQAAFDEGFTVNGESKFKKKLLKHRVYMLHENYVLHSLSGFATHMFYYGGVEKNGDESVVRIDFAKYSNGLDDFIIKGKINATAEQAERKQKR